VSSIQSVHDLTPVVFGPSVRCLPYNLATTYTTIYSDILISTVGTHYCGYCSVTALSRYCRSSHSELVWCSDTTQCKSGREGHGQCREQRNSLDNFGEPVNSLAPWKSARYNPWLAERCELYIRPYIVAMKDLIDTAGKEQCRGELNCVRLALIDATFSHQTAMLK